jgi:hypothetical protein
MTPARNRVTPLGDIVAIPLRGAWTGNRGILHAGREIVRFHAGKPMDHLPAQVSGPPARAVAAASLHLPLLPRRGRLVRRRAPAVRGVPPRELRGLPAAWAEGLGVDLPSAKAMNERLHAERIVRGTHRRRLHDLRWADLPDGAFVLVGETPALVAGGQVVEWTREGYRSRRPRPVRGTARVLTPPATVAALRAGYAVQVDDAARG